MSLAGSESLLEEILRSMGEALIVTRDDGTIELFSEGAERLFGYASREIVGRPLDLLVPPASRRRHADHLAAFAAGNERRRLMGGRPDIRGLRRDGTTFPAEASISRIVHGGEVHLAAVVQDLTALKQLSEMERSLQNAQRIASLGNWDWQVETGELWWSDEIYRIFGREPRSFGATYQAFLAAVHPDDRAAVQRAVDLALRQEAPYDIEHRIVRPGGEVRTVREQGEVVLEGGRPVRMIGLVHDVTERIEMEARLHQAQKLETLGRLTGGIAHDFNNLLTVVMGNLDIARAELGDDHPVVELLDEAGRAVELGSGLTDRLLTFSRRQHLQPQVVDADGVLQGLHGLLQRTLGERVRVAVEAAPGAWPCLADPGQLQNAVLNLAINARDAMPDGGRLCLAVTNRSLDATQAQQLPDASPGDYVRFSVSDTGAGMEPYVRERAFDPFFTTKERGRGTGLGLSMVYGFVVQSGGFVEIDTAPGEGTTFHLHLPRATAAAADEPPWDAVVRGDARNPQRNAKPR